MRAHKCHSVPIWRAVLHALGPPVSVPKHVGLLVPPRVRNQAGWAATLVAACPVAAAPIPTDKHVSIAFEQDPELVRLDTDTKISPDLSLAFFTVR